MCNIYKVKTFQSESFNKTGYHFIGGLVGGTGYKTRAKNAKIPKLFAHIFSFCLVRKYSHPVWLVLIFQKKGERNGI